MLAGADADANGVPDAAGAVIMGGKGEGSPSVEEHHYAETDMVFEGRRRLDLCEDMLRPQRGIALVWGKLYSMPLIKGIDGFNETLSLGEDAEYAFRAVAAANRIGYVDEMVYEYRRNADSWCGRSPTIMCGEQYLRSKQCAIPFVNFGKYLMERSMITHYFI